MYAIAVTGATGMLGAHFLTHACKHFSKITALYRNEEKIEAVKAVFMRYYPENGADEFSKIIWKQVDLSDPLSTEDAIQGCDLVFNLAATVSFDGKNPNQLIASNSGITETVVNACLHLGINRLVHVSSVAALGRKEAKTEGIGIDENTHWEISKNNSVYAISKYRAEMEAWRGMVEGMNVLVVNPPIILAPGFWQQSSGKLLPAVAKGLPFYTYGENGFVDVRDLCRAMIALVEKDKWNERYIVSGVHTSYKALFTKMAEALQVKPPYIHLNTFLGNVFWRLECLRSRLTGSSPLLTKETFRSSQNKYRYLSDKLKKDVNFTFTPINDTIDWMKNWYLQH